MSSDKVPVTVLTGFLGAGKTTLLNRILTEPHGLRIAVIENEYGEIGIDQGLVVSADEEIFEMNNGCICCTVRGDLIRILGNLMKRRDKFDRILVETTGLADPGPVAQTFFMDDETSERFALDGIITLVDAKHVAQHIDSSSECREQIAFADMLILNKCDLASEDELSGLEARIRSINSLAKIQRARHAAVPVAELLDVGGFDLDRALSIRPTFLKPEYPFEWTGIYALASGRISIELGHEHHCDGGDHEHDGHRHEDHHEHDHALELVVLRLDHADDATLAKSAEDAVRVFAEPLSEARVGAHFEHRLDSQSASIEIEIAEAGLYAVFGEHAPEELGMRLIQQGQTLAPALERAWSDGHTHDEGVSSVGLSTDRLLDPKRTDEWLSKLLADRGADLYRSKGILAFAGAPNRYVFQGVHMMLDGREERAWAPDEPRVSQLVFIGKNLDREALDAGFRRCCV